jgi:hypothetical protein
VVNILCVALIMRNQQDLVQKYIYKQPLHPDSTVTIQSLYTTYKSLGGCYASQ